MMPIIATPAAAATAELVAVLDAAERLPGASELRAETYRRLRLQPGQACADVGCGAGTAVEEMRLLGAHTFGVDPNQEMLAVARHRWPEGDFREGSAEALPVPDGGVEGYRADKVLHEVADPGLVLAEARRVLAPGGRIVLLGQDWEGLIIDAGDPDLTRTLVHARARSLPSPRAARAYRALLLDHGFHDVEVTVHTALFTDSTMLPLVQGLAATGAVSGAVDPDQARGWAADQVNRIREGRFLLVMPLFLASAVRP